MKKVLFVLLMISMSSYAIAQGEIYGPSFESAAVSGWTSNGVAYFATGVGCSDNTSATAPDALCDTPHVIGQAFCTTEYWTKKGLNASNAPREGNVCWCRRTHVRVNDNLTFDQGPWVLLDSFDTAQTCNSNCAYLCASTGNLCADRGGWIVFLPVE